MEDKFCQKSKRNWITLNVIIKFLNYIQKDQKDIGTFKQPQTTKTLNVQP